ncbi:MAG: hypothetical protein ACOX9C_11125 [Kiritimatiellia bacterium]|jgi:hypothetical protein
MNRKTIGSIGALFALALGGAAGQEAATHDAPPMEREGPPLFARGGDNRTRYELTDNWPRGSTVSTSYDEHLRFRTRLWGELRPADALLVRARIGNEFRSYRNSPANNSRNKFPDELYLDNLFVQWREDGWGLKAGRQEYMKGSRRILGDGTPGDGSRTAFFDAVVLTLDCGEKSSVDVFGAWNHYRDDITVGRAATGVYDLTFMRRGDPYSKMDEGGVGLYAECRELDALAIDLYWVWKKETSFHGGADRFPGRDFHTIGLRLLPTFNDWLSGELEAAWQAGRVDSQGARVAAGAEQDAFASRDISAGMAYAALVARPKDVAWSPSLRLAALYMSGDEDSYHATTDGSTDTGWNPVFGRLPASGDIPLYMYDVGRWSNLFHPHAEIGIVPAKGHPVTVEVGPMYAVEKDAGAESRCRGLYTRAVYRFPLPTLVGVKFNGLVAGEVFEYGDYFDTDESRATSVRLELNASF